jgi:SAM-dependent methyltransferase
MTRLYSKLALVYHEMYQSIFDYRKDFLRFQSILKKYHCKSVLELGCGTGMLAPYFLSAGYRYKGLDSSRAMLALPASRPPKRTSSRPICAAFRCGRRWTQFWFPEGPSVI